MQLTGTDSSELDWLDHGVAVSKAKIAVQIRRNHWA
jgi:hypothetical protein